MSALHHLRLNVADLERAAAFYRPLLGWLGFEELASHGDGKAERLRFRRENFVLLLSTAARGGCCDRTAVGLHHMAFAVESREAVDRCYAEVLLHLPGVEIEDPPVECPEYRQGYYATFFYDPDGIKLEVAYTP